MSRTGYPCPICEGVDTIKIAPDWLLCHDCGDEYDLKSNGGSRSRARVANPPPSSAAPVAGDSPAVPPAQGCAGAAPSSSQARATEARVWGRMETLSGYHSRPQPC